MTDARSFDEIYANVPPEQAEHLREFRAKHPPQYHDHAGLRWEFLRGGQQGAEAVLLLVGGLRVADAAYRSMPELEGDFDVITPSYPAAQDMAGLADGLAALLDAAGIERAHVLAGSFGGMVAQVFMTRHPQRVDKLVLSTTTIPDPAQSVRYETLRQMVAAGDEDTVRQMARVQMFEVIAPPAAMHDFYRAYLDELYSQRLGKHDMLSTYDCLIDFHNHYRLSADDLKNWPGQMLILESDDDATFDENARAAVHRLYPHAQTYTFHNAGHSPGTSQRELYFSVVREFFGA